MTAHSYVDLFPHLLWFLEVEAFLRRFPWPNQQFGLLDRALRRLMSYDGRKLAHTLPLFRTCQDMYDRDDLIQEFVIWACSRRSSC